VRFSHEVTREAVVTSHAPDGIWRSSLDRDQIEIARELRRACYLGRSLGCLRGLECIGLALSAQLTVIFA
jgi:hypothetical protein